MVQQIKSMEVEPEKIFKYKLTFKQRNLKNLDNLNSYRLTLRSLNLSYNSLQTLEVLSILDNEKFGQLDTINLSGNQNMAISYQSLKTLKNKFPLLKRLILASIPNLDDNLIKQFNSRKVFTIFTKDPSDKLLDSDYDSELTFGEESGSLGSDDDCPALINMNDSAQQNSTK